MQAFLCVVILAVVASSAHGQYCQTGMQSNQGMGYGVVSSVWQQTGSTYVTWSISQGYCNTMCASAVKTSCTTSSSNTATSVCSSVGSISSCSWPLGGSYCLATSTCPSSFTETGTACSYAFNCSSPACFSGDSTVETRDRSVVSISNLRKGDFVKAFDTASNKQIFSRFVSYAHADAQSVAKFVEVRTSGQKLVKLSDKHLIARVAGSGTEFVFAKELTVGDVVLTEGEHTETVTSVEETLEQGVFAPLTEQGTVIVDGVVASCYANYRSHELAHLVHPWVVSLAEFANAFLGYKDTTEMAEKLNLYGLLAQLPVQSIAL